MTAKDRTKSELLQQVAELEQRIKELEAENAVDAGKDSDSIWREFSEKSTDHLIILGRDLTILNVNHPSPGLTTRDLIGKKITAFLDEEDVSEIREILQGVIESQEPAVYQTQFRTDDGSLIHYETHAVPRIDGNHVIGLMLSSRDISYRKKTEEELQSERDKIQSIFRSAPIGIGVVSNRILQHVNKYLVDLLGYERSELMQQNARILYPTQEEYDYVGEEKYRQIDSMGIGSVETRFKKKNGEIIDVFLSSSPIDPENLASGVTFSVLDISDRILSERALMESQRQYATLLSNLPGMAYRAKNDRFYTMMYVSSGAIDLTGYSPDDLEENKSIAFIDIIHQDDREMVIANIRSALEENIPFQLVYRITTSKGIEKWVWEQGQGILGDDHELIALEGFITDITERVQAEQTFRTATNIINNSPAVAFSWINAEGWPVEYVSDNAESLFGYSKEDFLSSTILYSDLIFADDLARVTQEVEAAGYDDDQEVILHAPYRIRAKNGEVIWVSDKTSVNRDDDGNIISYQGVVFDISKEINATEDLRTRTKELNFLLRTSQALSSSSDLNQVLQIITNSAADLSGVDSAAIYLLDGEEVYLGATTPPLAIEVPETFRRAKLEDHPGIKTALTKKEVHILHDALAAELSDPERTIIEARGLRTIVFLPILVEDLVLGTLILGTVGVPRTFSVEEINLSQALTNQIAISLQNSILHDDTAQYLSALEEQIQERIQAEQEKDLLLLQVQEANERLKDLSRELISSQEEERKRISQELHDEFGQALTGISLDLVSIERTMHADTSKDTKEKISEVRKLTDDLDRMIGELALDLRPSLLDDLGLMPTLNWYVERYRERTEIEVDIEVIGDEVRLPIEIETALYRIVQEALTNVVKHASAKHVNLKLGYELDRVNLSIKDNGTGFDLEGSGMEKVSPRGLGLLGMADRAALIGGEMNIHTRPGAGTNIVVVVPH